MDHEHEHLHITASGAHSVAAQRIGEVHVHRPGRGPAPWPHLVGSIPPRADGYRPRAETARLTAALAGGGAVLTGLPGSGKTQLAAEHARSGLQDGTLDVVVWITAGSAAAVADGYARAGIEVLGADPGDRPAAAAEFRSWLDPRRQERPCRWLTVLDDVADPNDLRGLLPPHNPHGRTLITTRLRDAALAASHRPGVEVGTFTPDEAVDQLARALGRHGRVEPAEQLRALAADLGHLPLALSQAAVHLVQEHLGAAEYRELLAAQADLTPYYLPDDQPHAVAAALALAVERATGPARGLLQLAALLDPNGIPDSVLTARPVLDHLGTDQARTGLRTLHRLGLIRHTPEAPQQAVRVHQLVQRATRAALTTAEHAQCARVAADALLADWPENEPDPLHAQALRTSAAALIGHAEPVLYRDGAHPLLLRQGISTHRAGRHADARAHFTRYADTAHRLLGPEHRDTLRARYYREIWAGIDLISAGALAALLEDQTRVLGADHRDTLRTRGILIDLRSYDDRTRQITDLMGVLLDQVRTLGPTDRDGLDTLRRIAALIGGTTLLGTELTEMLGELLATWEEALGPDDPEVRAAREALDRLLDDSGRTTAAAAAADLAELTEVLRTQEQRLGPGDRATLRTRRSITLVLVRAGRYPEALDALDLLLADETAALGPDHPDSFDTRTMRSFCLELLEGPDSGRAALEDLLTRQRRVLGPVHPSTLDTRRSIAALTGEAGRRGEAVAALADLLRDLLPALDPDHPVIARTLEDLAVQRTELADLRAAAAEVGDAAPARELLAELRAAEGDRVAVAAALAGALAGLTAAFGPGHAAVAALGAHLEFWQAES